MIVDLDQNLYVVDNRTHAHRISYIDVINKIVHTTDDLEFEYSTSPLTVTIKGE